MSLEGVWGNGCEAHVPSVLALAPWQAVDSGRQESRGRLLDSPKPLEAEEAPLPP